MRYSLPPAFLLESAMSWQAVRPTLLSFTSGEPTLHLDLVTQGTTLQQREQSCLEL